jgi:hypothetical protein
MGIPKEGNCLNVIPLNYSVSNGYEGPIFVDIGGNTSQQAGRLLAKHPDPAGRVVVQYREETVKRVPGVKGVQFMAHDFFSPQSVKGKSSILHNSDDDKGVKYPG